MAISSRALFDLGDSHRVFTEQGVAEYSKYQIAHEEDPLAPGEAFNMVKKLLAINDGMGDQAHTRVEVILLSRNSADTGLRIFNSIKHHGLPIRRAAFCGGDNPWRYIKPFGCALFLSRDGGDVGQALAEGVAAAHLMGGHRGPDDGQLRFAFDGDAVLFSDEAERIYQEQGLPAFAASEEQAAHRPLSGGPFKNFLHALQALQSELPSDESPIRTALVTARAAPAHERAVRTLRDWNIRLDESLFLGGQDKGEFLRAYGADIFFDDQHENCDSARRSRVPTARVPPPAPRKKRR